VSSTCLNGEHFEARQVERGRADDRGLTDERRPEALAVEAAVGIGEDVELDLPHALGLELLVERQVRVLPGQERGGDVDELAPQRLHRLHVIAVVAAEGLDVVQAHAVQRELGGEAAMAVDQGGVAALGAAAALRLLLLVTQHTLRQPLAALVFRLVVGPARGRGRGLERNEQGDAEKDRREGAYPLSASPARGEPSR
jgi:hypothetical protein